MKLTPNYTLEEMIISQEATRQGLNNSPPDHVFLHLIRTCKELEKVRELLGHPILVSSGYRSPAVNKAIGGATASHHMLGLACDFTCPGFGTPFEVCNKIRESDINYDQLIHEFGVWIHIGFDDKPRRQNLTAKRGPDGETIYLHGHVAVLERRK